MAAITGSLIAGGLAAAGSIGGAAIGANAAGSATDKSVNAQREGMASQERLAREGMAYQERQAGQSNQLLRDFYGQAQTQLKPFQDAQLGALGQAVGLTDPNNPVYQQQRDVNTQAIQRQLAAQGLLRSKNQVDLLSNLELGLNQQRVGQINSLMGLGAVQQGAQNTMGLGGGLANIASQLGANVGSSFSQMGANNANSLAQIGQTQAQGIMANANAWGGALSGLGNIAQGTIGNIQGIGQRKEDREWLSGLIGGGANPQSLAGLSAFFSQYGGRQA